MRRRRPLLRAAAVGGGAYLAGKQRGRDEAAEGGRAAPLSGAGSGPAVAPQGLSPDAVEQLKSLSQLHEQGILTDQEFDQQKAKVLQGT